ncbi:hypothetical protein BH23CHL7_BH23CHL7_07750 [soil metagenome]
MRYVSIVLGLALVLVIGGIALMIATNPGSPAGSPIAGVSPSPTPEISPTPLSPSPSPSPSPPPIDEPTPEASPTNEPTPTPDDIAPSPAVSAEPSPTIEPSPSPSPTPAAPTREVTFIELGLDNSGNPEETVTPRYFTFRAQGPGIIRAQLSRVTGRVRACIWQGDAHNGDEQSCQTMRRGVIERELAGGEAQTFTLSLIGSEAGSSPSATVRIGVPTNELGMRLEGFRFQGLDNEGYNGFVVEVRAATAGTLSVLAVLDDGEGGAHPYQLVVQSVGGGPSQPFIAEGEGTSVVQSTDVVAERSYLVRLENRDRIADALVLLTADLAWP